MFLIAGLGIIGLLCIYFEFFVPGGILALLGALSLIGSVSSLIFFTDISWGWFLGYIVFLLVATACVCYLALKHIRRSGKKDSFFLQTDQTGFSVESLPRELVGQEGIVVTELKPSGHVRIGEEVYQALSEGGFVQKNTCIEVLEVKGSYLAVKIKSSI